MASVYKRTFFLKGSASLPQIENSLKSALNPSLSGQIIVKFAPDLDGGTEPWARSMCQANSRVDQAVEDIGEDVDHNEDERRDENRPFEEERVGFDDRVEP